MKVKIVDQKDDVKEMTIEELSRKAFVGAEWNNKKFSLEDAGIGWAFASRFYTCGFLGGSPCSKREKIQEIADYHSPVKFHYFKDARELYLWMAE